MSLAELVRRGSLDKAVPMQALETSIVPLAAPLALVDINTKFDPCLHLAFTPEDVERTRRLTMSQLNIHSKDAILEIGVTDPFPLFTLEAIKVMRAELLRTEVFEKYSRIANSSTSKLLDWMVRGYAKKACPFTYAAWTHPSTVAAVLAMAGVELEVVFDYEVAHVNVLLQLPELYEADRERIALSRKSSFAGTSDGKDMPAVVNWHHDAYPFVCVLLLSDTTEMVGGETSLRMGCAPGEVPQVAVVPGPKQGHAAVLQGRLIEHIAPKPLGYSERITAVTSYRAKNPLMPDKLVLETVKPEVMWSSRYSEFYPDWVQYRTQVVEARTSELRKKALELSGSPEFRKEDTIAALKELEQYIRGTWTEMEHEADAAEECAIEE